MPDRLSSTLSAQQSATTACRGTPKSRLKPAGSSRLRCVSLAEARRASAGRTLRRVCRALKRADLEAELACLRQIKEAAQNGDWRAAAWMLERRYPEKWGRRRTSAQRGRGSADGAVQGV